MWDCPGVVHGVGEDTEEVQCSQASVQRSGHGREQYGCEGNGESGKVF